MGTITKSERLQELKIQDQIFKAFDKVMDAGWREYVKDIKNRHAISNERTFRILAQIKGNDFVKDLRDFMRSTKNKDALISFTKKPQGMILKDSRFKNIPQLWVDQKQTGIYGDGANGSLYIQIQDNRWIEMCYYNIVPKNNKY